MKSHNWLLEALLHDCAVQCSVPPREIALDLRTVSHRVESEGLSFLTITLPSFGSAILRALSDGCLPSTGIQGFRGSRGLPSFLRGFLKQVFDTSGRLVDEPNVIAVACLHQICNTFKKVALPCASHRVETAIRQYIDTDRDLPERPLPGAARLVTSKDGSFRIPPLDQLSRDFRVLFYDALLPLDRDIYEGKRIEAKHGPGATAERVLYNDKFRWSQWTERLSRIFDSSDYVHAMEHSAGGGADPLQIPLVPTPEEQETPVRVITVPKTQKTPRIIAIEPVVMQYMQQGLLAGITKGIKGSFIGASTLFDDQSVNAKRALEASGSGFYATLDLKEASDRVTFWIVDSLIRPWLPNLMEALDCTRSRRARLPGLAPRARLCKSDRVRPSGDARDRSSQAGPSESLGRPSLDDREGTSHDAPISHSRDQFPDVIHLRKFASMGSAVCFPVEAMVFTTIVFRAVADFRNLQLTPDVARRLASDILVYGDDIIVPTDCAPIVTLYLEAFGLKVNTRKSYWTGKFRESCGTDAYDGTEVTPAYLKTLIWGDERTLDWLALWVEFSNSLYNKGFWETSRIIRKRIAIEGYRIPMVSATSPAIGYHNIRGTYEWHSWDAHLQKPVVKAYQYRSKRSDSPLDDIAALRKVMTTPFNEDSRHLLSATRSASVGTKKRWASAF